MTMTKTRWNLFSEDWLLDLLTWSRNM